MRKITKLMVLACLCALMVLCCSGCGSGSESGDGENGQGAGADSGSAPKFDFSGIEWSVDSGVIDGYRVVMFNYNNNTDYDIAELSLEFKLRGDVTEEEVNKFSELKEKAKNMEKEPTELTIEAWAKPIVESGGSANDIPMQLDGTIEYFTTYDAYELFEPDMMTAYYIKGNKIYTAYYDYSTQETSYDSDVIDAYGWSDSEIAGLLPKPDARIAVVQYDDESRFRVDIHGVGKEFYEDYIAKCKEKGFTKNVDDDSDWIWRAEDKAGNELEISVDDTDQIVGIAIDAADE